MPLEAIKRHYLRDKNGNNKCIIRENNRGLYQLAEEYILSATENTETAKPVLHRYETSSDQVYLHINEKIIICSYLAIDNKLTGWLQNTFK